MLYDLHRKVLPFFFYMEKSNEPKVYRIKIKMEKKKRLETKRNKIERKFPCIVHTLRRVSWEQRCLMR